MTGLESKGVLMGKRFMISVFMAVLITALLACPVFGNAAEATYEDAVKQRQAHPDMAEHSRDFLSPSAQQLKTSDNGSSEASDSSAKKGSSKSAVTRPAAPEITSLESKTVRRLKVKWTEVSGVNGYEVRYKTGTTKMTETVEDPDITRLVLQDLLCHEEYTVRVRSFQTADGENVYSKWSEPKTETVTYTKWSDLQDKFSAKEKVNQLIFVKYQGGTKARLQLFDKQKDGSWEKVLGCKAVIGQNGLNKTKEGDRKTPTGTFTITHAFGVLKDPGSKMDYIKLKDHHYWCGDRDWYNQMIDIRKHPHSCRGEHLITYTKQYAYSMALDYNKKCVYGKGSAIFLHCFGYYDYTLGCIAVSQDNMKTILKTCGDNTKICIYPK